MSMTKEEKLQDPLRDTLKDIDFAEKKIPSALPKMAKAANSDELRAACRKQELQRRAAVVSP
jgi:ferritin-like metal-binding protein YciE